MVNVRDASALCRYKINFVVMNVREIAAVCKAVQIQKENFLLLNTDRALAAAPDWGGRDHLCPRRLASFAL